MPVVLDDSRFPAAQVTLSGALTDDETRGFLSFVTACYAREQRWTMLVNATGLERPSPTQRRMVSDVMNQDRAHKQTLMRGIGVVVDNPLIRGVVTAILWLANPGYPIRMFDGVDAARAWLETLPP